MNTVAILQDETFKGLDIGVFNVSRGAVNLFDSNFHFMDVYTQAGNWYYMRNMYNKALVQASSKYEVDSDKLFFCDIGLLSCNPDEEGYKEGDSFHLNGKYDIKGFQQWLHFNDFTFAFFSGFIMEGKTKRLNEFIENIRGTRELLTCFYAREEEIIPISEVDSLWRAPSKKLVNGMPVSILDTPTDLWMIRFLWLSAYIKQLYNFYLKNKSETDVRYFVLADRFTLDHDIFDYTYRTVNLTEICSDGVYQFTTMAFAHIFRLYCSKLDKCATSSLSTYKTTLLFERFRSILPFPVQNIPGREFEYKFYTNLKEFRNYQSRFYLISDFICGLPNIVFEYSKQIKDEISLDIRCLNNLARDLYSYYGEYMNYHVVRDWDASDTENDLLKNIVYATYDEKRDRDMIVRNFYRWIHNIVQYVVPLESHWFKCCEAPLYLKYKDRFECIKTSCYSGFWGSGKSQSVRENKTADVKIYECSDLWRAYPYFFENDNLMFATFLVNTVFTMNSRMPIDSLNNIRELSVLVDRSPVCFAAFTRLSTPENNSHDVFKNYIKIYGSILGLFALKRVEINSVVHEDRYTAIWPITLYRKIEIERYPTIEVYCNAKQTFFHILDKFEREIYLYR